MAPSFGKLLLASALVGSVAAQTKRLKITNGCSNQPMWIAHMSGGTVGPDPQNIKINPGEEYSFNTPDGLSATRYWPKFACRSDGNHCQLGGSGGPGQECDPAFGCGPPVDTKFEGTFGKVGQSCSSGYGPGCDFVDMSMVDGWTVPFKFEIDGTCFGNGGKVLTNEKIDCSKVTYDSCPTHENMGAAGSSVDLRVIHPKTGTVSGCYSPCSKLTYSNWGNKFAEGRSPADTISAPYCCPTPPESPDQCRAGPVPNTQYVQAVHNKCPGVYGYSYDDGVGLLVCASPAVYKVTFYCPSDVPPAPSPSPSPSPSPAPAGKCSVGDSVTCPGTSVGCAGNSCCPDLTTCPSAANSFKGCPKPKATDCTTKAGLDFTVVV